MSEKTSNYYYHLIEKDGVIALSNLPSEHYELFSECNILTRLIADDKNNKYRDGKLTTEFGTAYLLTNEKELLISAKSFKGKLKLHADFLGRVREMKSRILRDLLHDLTKLNGHLIQEFFYLIPQEELSSDYIGQLEAIQKRIRQDGTGFSQMMLRAIKLSLSMKAEFTKLNATYGTPALRINSHPIHKVIVNALQNFYFDLRQNVIAINIEDNIERIRLDYETFHGALLSFFDNAVKYTMPNSPLRISFIHQDGNYCIRFEMTSLRIYPDEVDKIFHEEYSGDEARKANKNGRGLGVGFIKRMLALNDAEMVVRPNVDKRYQVRIGKTDCVYEDNQFDMLFKGQS